LECRNETLVGGKAMVLSVVGRTVTRPHIFPRYGFHPDNETSISTLALRIKGEDSGDMVDMLMLIPEYAFLDFECITLPFPVVMKAAGMGPIPIPFRSVVFLRA
jgi:hypothetical protein